MVALRAFEVGIEVRMKLYRIQTFENMNNLVASDDICDQVTGMYMKIID